MGLRTPSEVATLDQLRTLYDYLLESFRYYIISTSNDQARQGSFTKYRRDEPRVKSAISWKLSLHMTAINARCWQLATAQTMLIRG